jgi:hypothetical protein
MKRNNAVPLCQVTVVRVKRNGKHYSRYGSIREAVGSFQWWVVLDEAERDWTKFVFGL